MPPCASGPVFTVSRPSRNGSDCAIAGVGKRLSAAAAPAALPANIVRRLTLRVLGLADIPRPPFFPVLIPRLGAAGVLLRRHCRVGGYHWRGKSRCKARYCRVLLNTSSAADSRANRPDERGIPAPARSRTG